MTKEELVEMLRNAKNLILTGAPGTGKTHFAKQIAYAITGDDNNTPEEERHWAFVQFHPSYDYTDFVEGLRPTRPGKNGNIGFERKDGIFKEFCRKALAFQGLSEDVPEQQESPSADSSLVSFEVAWNKMIEYLKNNRALHTKTLNGKKPLKIELNETGTGLVHGEKRDRYINRDQLLSVYQGKHGVPRKGGDNYRKAVIKEMKKTFGLQEYKANNTTTQDTNPSPTRVFVFIIDEINRGDIAKIFGELFFAIDPDYRGKKGAIKTQYASLFQDDKEFPNGMFYVPENVYIIGTMNDIDRNVECMDFAIRRRFTWVEIKPEDTVTMLNDPEKGIPEYKGKAQKCMDAINKAIKKMPGLGSAYQLGAAYFLKLKNYGGDFELLWKNHIGPLLKEYLRGMPDAEATVNSMKQKWDSALRAEAAETAEIPAAAQPETELQPESAENQPATEQQ